MSKINTAYIKQEIPNWMSQAEFDELCEVWTDNMADFSDEDKKESYVADKVKIDFPVYCKIGKNWKRVHKAKYGSDIIRVFELSPGPVFEGIYKLEVVTDGTDSTVLHTCFYNE